MKLYIRIGVLQLDKKTTTLLHSTHVPVPVRVSFQEWVTFVPCISRTRTRPQGKCNERVRVLFSYRTGKKDTALI